MFVKLKRGSASLIERIWKEKGLRERVFFEVFYSHTC
jgi:hypothetical protein